jgi:hypothetical protein
VVRVASGPALRILVDKVEIDGTVLPLPEKDMTSMQVRVEIH